MCYKGAKDVWTEGGRQGVVIITHLLACVAILVCWAIIFGLLYVYFMNRDKNRPKEKPEEASVPVTPHAAPRHPIEPGKDLPYDYKTTLPTSQSQSQNISLDASGESKAPTKDDKTAPQTADKQKVSSKDQTKAKTEQDPTKTDKIVAKIPSGEKGSPKPESKIESKDVAKAEPKSNLKTDRKDKTTKADAKDRVGTVRSKSL